MSILSQQDIKLGFDALDTSRRLGDRLHHRRRVLQHLRVGDRLDEAADSEYVAPHRLSFFDHWRSLFKVSSSRR
jgi:hypothetical protein